MVNKLPANAGVAEDMGSIPGWEDPLEEKMAIHSSVLAGKISQTKEPGWVYSPPGRKESETTGHACKILGFKYLFITHRH